jgi:hypothetical protein
MEPIFTLCTFILFNCSSLRVSAFEAGQVTCCVIGDKWFVKCSTYLTLFISTSASVGWLTNLALPELGTAQPQLVLFLYLPNSNT